MAGISGLPNRRFQFFNWLSALLWVCVVTGLGYALSMIPFVKRHEDQVMTCLMILPIALLYYIPCIVRIRAASSPGVKPK